MVNRISNEDGFDITEGVQTILDALAQSMDAGSGMLDYREWCAIRQVAWALGVDPDKITVKEYEYSGGHEWFECTTAHGSNNPAQANSPVAIGLPHQHARWAQPYVAPWPDPAAPLTDEPSRNTDDD